MNPQKKHMQGGRPAQPELVEALRLIKERESITQIMTILNEFDDLKSIDRSTIFRWRKNNRSHRYHDDAIKRIIRVANALREHEKSPFTIRFAVIPHATEMLPILLLDRLPHIKGAVKIELLERESINDCFFALSKGQVDMILGPRHITLPSENIKRLCKLVELQVDGIFPGTHSNSYRLAESLEQNKREIKGFTIGILPNAEYRSIIQSFLSDHGGLPGTDDVRNYIHAFEGLKGGKIHGVIGHSVFVENCYKKIVEYNEVAKRNQTKQIEGLERAPLGVFGVVKMDVFVNVDTKEGIKMLVARKALGLLDEVIKYINDNRNSEILADLVDDIVKLEGAPGKSGTNILKEYTYHMKTFETDVLFKLWK